MAKAAYVYVPFSIEPDPAHPQGYVAHRPLAIATITATNGHSLRCIVLPDSGADACLFPLSLAIMLKLDVLLLPKSLTMGVGSQANPTYYDKLLIDMGKGIVFTAYVGFTQGMDSVGMGLLGQDGFFDA
jgi:hypothetical protein